MLRKYRFIVPLLCLGLLVGCSKNNPVAPNVQPEQGKLMFALEAADNIASGTVTITKGIITHILPITITNHTGSVSFEGIQVGTWSITVQLFDAEGVEIYSGSGEAVVTKNQTTTVTIKVEHNAGKLVIIVEVPGPTPTPTPANMFRIIYGSASNGMRLMETDGKNIISDKQLVNMVNGGNVINYRGGNTFIYWVWRQGLWKMTLDGIIVNNAHKIYNSIAGSVVASWSYDGSNIVFSDASTDGIFIMNPDGSNVSQVPNTYAGYKYPDYTNDGRIIYKAGENQIYTQNIDGTNKNIIVTIPNSVQGAESLTCSINNQIIMYAYESGGNETKIFSVNVDGTDFKKLTNEQGAHGHFSADGQKIVFDSTRDGNNEIYMMNSDGSDETRITYTNNIDEKGPRFIY